MLSRRPVFPQTISTLLAYAIQAPYVYATDIYLMGMPHPLVVGIMGLLFVEDLLSALISHAILYRIDLKALLAKQ
jgi:hypothetical protein